MPQLGLRLGLGIMQGMDATVTAMIRNKGGVMGSVSTRYGRGDKVCGALYPRAEYSPAGFGVGFGVGVLNLGWLEVTFPARGCLGPQPTGEPTLTQTLTRAAANWGADSVHDPSGEMPLLLHCIMLCHPPGCLDH